VTSALAGGVAARGNGNGNNKRRHAHEYVLS
jgi:hypothetical protein